MKPIRAKNEREAFCSEIRQIPGECEVRIALLNELSNGQRARRAHGDEKGKRPALTVVVGRKSQTARTTTKVDATASIINAYKSASRQRGTTRLRRWSEGTAITSARAYAILGLPTRCIRRAQREEQMKQSVLAGLQFSRLLPEDFHLLLALRVRVGSRFWGHSAMIISRLAGTMELRQFVCDRRP
jgi:hypothetical protein